MVPATVVVGHAIFIVALVPVTLVVGPANVLVIQQL